VRNKNVQRREFNTGMGMNIMCRIKTEAAITMEMKRMFRRKRDVASKRN
jgi:hypothetical protein